MRDAEADLDIVVAWAVRHMCCVTYGTDWTMNFGWRRDENGPLGPTTTSAEEILAVLGIDAKGYGDNWPTRDLIEYAGTLWMKVPDRIRELLRKQCGMST